MGKKLGNHGYFTGQFEGMWDFLWSVELNGHSRYFFLGFHLVFFLKPIPGATIHTYPGDGLVNPGPMPKAPKLWFLQGVVNVFFFFFEILNITFKYLLEMKYPQ